MIVHIAHNVGTMRTARAARRGHSAHITAGSWGFLLPLAIFLPLWTILHPTMLHNLMFFFNT